MPDISPASVMNWHLCEIREKPRSLWTLSFTVGDVIWVRPNEGTGKEEEASEAGKEGRKEGRRAISQRGKASSGVKFTKGGTNERMNQRRRMRLFFLEANIFYLPLKQFKLSQSFL